MTMKLLLLLLSLATAAAWSPALAGRGMLPRSARRFGWPRAGVEAERDADAAEDALLEAIMAKRAEGKSDEEIMAELQELANETTRLRSEAGQTTREMAGGASADEMRARAGLPPALPGSGATDWGRWSQTAEGFSFELFVDEGTRGADVRCELLDTPGATRVLYVATSSGDEPRGLLSGRLAQGVLSEVDWALDSDSDAAEGMKVLCVELLKRERSAPANNDGGFDTPIFEFLRVRDDSAASDEAGGDDLTKDPAGMRDVRGSEAKAAGLVMSEEMLVERLRAKQQQPPATSEEMLYRE